MRILLVESTPGNAEEFARWLDDNGHDSIRCFTTDQQRVCRGVHDPEACALTEPIDAALLVRDLDQQHTLTEMGSVCAMRHRVPVVEVYECDRPKDVLPNAFGGAVFAAEIDGYVAAIRRALIDAPLLAPAIVEALPITVRRTPNRVEAVLSLPDVEPARRGMIADRAARALRRHDQFTNVIDVSIV